MCAKNYFTRNAFRRVPARSSSFDNLATFKRYHPAIFGAHLTKYELKISAKMSSPASRRSQRNSVSVTPQRSPRHSQQAPSSARSAQQTGSHATPRASRQNNIAASSPLLYHSSPLNGAQLTAGADEANGASRMNISSPLRQTSVADSTPRGRVPAPGGMKS